MEGIKLSLIEEKKALKDAFKSNNLPVTGTSPEEMKAALEAKDIDPEEILGAALQLKIDTMPKKAKTPEEVLALFAAKTYPPSGGSFLASDYLPKGDVTLYFAFDQDGNPVERSSKKKPVLVIFGDLAIAADNGKDGWFGKSPLNAAAKAGLLEPVSYEQLPTYNGTCALPKGHTYAKATGTVEGPADRLRLIIA